MGRTNWAMQVIKIKVHGAGRGDSGAGMGLGYTSNIAIVVHTYYLSTLKIEAGGSL